jgi:hypothetical protein
LQVNCHPHMRRLRQTLHLRWPPKMLLSLGYSFILLLQLQSNLRLLLLLRL